MPQRQTIMQRLMASGYTVKGAGKIFHHHLDGAFHDQDSFDEFQPMIPQVYPPEKLNGAPEYGSRNTDWGSWPPQASDSIDFQTATYCADTLIGKRPGRPLFLACGIFKPHSPFFAPAEMHRDYQSIKPPPRLADDWSDLPTGASSLLKNKKWFWKGMMALDQRIPGSYRRFIDSYAACVTHADKQIGRVLDALDQSGRADTTIILLWSDHGFHLGEKDHIEKFALWEKSTHVPLIVVAPGVTSAGSRCDRPVDLMGIYPTLLELCGHSPDPVCDGVSLVPLLKDPSSNWERPAIMTYGQGNHAIRGDRWRLIRYVDGTEELYDHATDPNEWNNLADDVRYRSQRDTLRRWLPDGEARPIADLRK